MISSNLLKFKFIKGPIIFNLYHYFAEPNWYPEPVNALDFRIKFIKKYRKLHELNNINFFIKIFK